MHDEQQELISTGKKVDYLEELERKKEKYEELVERLGSEIDKFQEKETPGGLRQINETLDEIHDLFFKEQSIEETITEEDMREVAEMIAADESWE